MAFYYRKSFNLGSFRVHFSKSGLGYSVGGRGFCVGTTARGKNIASPIGCLAAGYRVAAQPPGFSFSIPETGVGYRKLGAACIVLS